MYIHIRFTVQQQTRARRGPATNSCPPLNKTLQMKGRRAAAGVCVSVTVAMRQILDRILSEIRLALFTVSPEAFGHKHGLDHFSKTITDLCAGSGPAGC